MSVIKHIKEKIQQALILLCAILIICLTACGNEHSARRIINSQHMPEIVFIKEINYNEYSEDHSGDGPYAIIFCDKDGNCYSCDDQDVCSLKFSELVKEYAAGNLDDKLTSHETCDAKQVFKNYKRICSLSQKEKIELDYPEEIPAVETEIILWRGLYYNKNGEIDFLTFHKYECDTHIKAKDKRANTIYEWFKDNIK